MIVLDLSILNQKGTPMFNSDTFANRPAFGIVGRIFISIDTAAIYRDTGTAWDLIADGGSASTNIYNSNGTLSANRVVSDGGFGLSFTPTTHIGTATIGGGGNGKLIVGSSTADNGIQVFGANAPSIRIDNAQSGGTQRFVFGLATATNNFIQGATAGEFCISTQSAGNMLFGMWQSINASEVMRITTANNLLIGTSVDGGFKLSVLGTSNFNGAMTATTGAFGGGSVTAGNNIQSLNGHISTYHNVNADTSGYGILFYTNNGGTKNVISSIVPSGVGTNASGKLLFGTTLNGTSNLRLIITENGDIGQGTLTPDSLWSGDADVYHLKSSGTNSAGVRVQSNRGGNIELVCSGTTDDMALYSTTNWPLVIYTNSTERLRFLTSGDVKITNSIEIGNAVSVAVAAPSTHKVAILIGGVQYYLLASNV